MNTWQLQEAKSKFSEVVEKAIHSGPQRVTKRGNSAVIVLSEVDFHKLQERRPGLLDVLRNSPFVGTDLELERTKSMLRKFDL